MKLVTVADVVKARGCHRMTAYRFLRALHEKHGNGVVWRKGRSYVGDAEAIARVTSLSVDAQIEQLRNRLALLEAAYNEQDVRINGVTRDLVLVKTELRRGHGAPGARTKVRSGHVTSP